MVKTTSLPMPGENQARLLKWSIYILGFVFLLNCFTPLRLHYDMLRYFSIKDCIEGNCPPYADRNDYLPFGYTALLLLLSKMGILRSFSLVLVNCLYLFGGLYCVRKVFNYIKSPFFFFLLVLLNWTVIKFVTHPLSELQYLFFSLAGVYAFYQFTQTKKFLSLLMAFLLAGLAFITRTVGVTLLAALFVSLAWEYRKQLLELIKRNKVIVIVVLLSITGILIFSKQLGLNHYSGVMSKQFKEGLRFSDVIKWHFSEWGEILSNSSKAKAMSYLPARAGDWLFVITGILGVSGFVYICFIRKNRIPFIVRTYLLFYLLLMFNWPFNDPRFWVPVIPLIAAVISQTSFPKNRVIKFIGLFYLLIYAALGIASLGYLTYTSFNKKAFSKSQAKGTYRNEYETHFFGKTLSDTATHTDPDLVEFLNKYDR
jgi:hypothetical protein